MNRMAAAMQHLRARLETSAAEIATEIRRGGPAGEILFSDIPVVPTVWRRSRKEQEGTPATVVAKVWLISTARVPGVLREADFLKIGGVWYRIGKDEIDEQVFQVHGEHDSMRAYNSVAWGV